MWFIVLHFINLFSTFYNSFVIQYSKNYNIYCFCFAFLLNKIFKINFFFMRNKIYILLLKKLFLKFKFFFFNI